MGKDPQLATNEKTLSSGAKNVQGAEALARAVARRFAAKGLVLGPITRIERTEARAATFAEKRCQADPEASAARKNSRGFTKKTMKRLLRAGSFKIKDRSVAQVSGSSN